MEVLVVDDGSRDGTGDLARRVARLDSRVQVLEGRGRGIVAALELARSHARGACLARMDADDVALPTRLQDQLDLLRASVGAGLCGAGVRYFPDRAVRAGARRYEQWLNSLVSQDHLLRDRFIECPLAHPTWMARARAVEEVGGYRDPGWPEDWDLLLRMVEANWGLVSAPRIGLLWREADERLSRTHPRYSPDAFLRCRVHYLRRAWPNREEVVVWGAGPTGKGFSRAWTHAGGRVAAFVELDPRKIGQEIHGAPVVAPDGLSRFSGALGVAAVGRDGAREDVRGGFEEQGWLEGRDFVTVA
jgi:glycosyltransferase involved in cell wall biosynthesis